MSKYINRISPQYFAFNIWSIESAKAVICAAAQMRQDVILQTSGKAFDVLDKEALRWFVTHYAEKMGIHAFLHLDHSRRPEAILESVRAGWDSVMIDASDKPLEENIWLTNEVCASIAKIKKNVLVEAEIGRIYGAEDEIASKEDGMGKIEEIEEFVHRVNIDMLAVAIGTAHGQYKGIPRIQYGLIKKTGEITDVPLVVHGGSGLDDAAIIRLLSYKNVKKINISTDVKLAYRAGIERSREMGYMKEEDFDPLRVTEQIQTAVEHMVIKKLSLLEK